jgi:hypothetical protein
MANYLIMLIFNIVNRHLIIEIIKIIINFLINRIKNIKNLSPKLKSIIIKIEDNTNILIENIYSEFEIIKNKLLFNIFFQNY